ncbi:DedA family protein [Paenibacillus athensensis]|nr:DedA family protein [Paenibacillus athensensis]
MLTVVGSWTAPGGPFTFTKALMCVYAGTMTGMVVSYALGHRVGKPFLYRFGKWVKLTPSRLERAERWFHKYGLWTVFFGYFVPGLRHLTCYLSGMSGVKFYKYVLYAGTGALLWCTSFLVLGHFIGRNLESMLHMLHGYIGMSVAAVAVLAGLVLWLLLRFRKRTI